MPRTFRIFQNPGILDLSSCNLLSKFRLGKPRNSARTRELAITPRTRALVQTLRTSKQHNTGFRIIYTTRN